MNLRRLLLFSLATSPARTAFARESTISERPPLALNRVVDLRAHKGDATIAVCAAHSVEGDGGGGIFLWEPGAQRRDDGGITLNRDDGSGSWIRQYPAGEISVRWFGARGNGIADDTNALESAHRAANLSSSAGARSSVLYPAGQYVYRGEGIRQIGGTLSMRGTSASSTTIVMQSDAYFLELEGFIESTLVSHLGFKGGRGGFRYQNTGQNVSSFHVFEHCEFRGYRECAIGNNSSDHPYLKVRFCTFMGDPAARTIGVAWGGYVDGLTIEDCAFLWNSYHIKLGPRLSGSISVRSNDFIKWSLAPRMADIWIVPNSTERHGVNSGGGIVIAQNKFGVENQLPDEQRILIAVEDETSAADRLSKPHSKRWIPDLAYVQGLVFERNRFDGVANLSAPLIKSHVNEIRRLDFSGNFFGGGPYTYLCEFAALPPAIEQPYTTRTWNIEIGSHQPGLPPFTKDISNHARGLCRDLFGSLQGSQASLLPASSGDDTGYVQLSDSAVAPRLHNCNTTTSEGSLGPFSRGTEIHFEASTGIFAVPLRQPLADRITWVEFDARQGKSLPLSRLRVRVSNPSKRCVVLSESFGIQDSWHTLRIPFIFSAAQFAEPWVLEFLPDEAIQGKGRAVCVARASVYHARQPMNRGHLRTIGSGSWNEEHIVLGNSHIWLDRRGRLRVKQGLPVADEDGQLV